MLHSSRLNGGALLQNIGPPAAHILNIIAMLTFYLKPQLQTAFKGDLGLPDKSMRAGI